MKNNIISIIIPAYNEEKNIYLIYSRLEELLRNYLDYEIIFIDDGSTDNTLNHIKDIRQSNARVHYLVFSRNFGHQNALKAGFDFSRGNCVISLDADLQHPPELIVEMIDKWKQGFDIVYTIREDDKRSSLLKRVTSGLFYKIINLLSDLNVKKGAADFRLLDRKVVDVLKKFNEHFLFYRGLVSWLGFKKYAIKYAPNERFGGKSKYSLKRMISFALNGITSFSIRPLRVSIFLGLFLSIISFCYGFYAVFMKLFTNRAISGWASVLTSVLFIGGMQFMFLGILGEYLGKLFIESKKRPNYIIKDISFNESDEK